MRHWTALEQMATVKFGAVSKFADAVPLLTESLGKSQSYTMEFILPNAPRPRRIRAEMFSNGFSTANLKSLPLRTEARSRNVRRVVRVGHLGVRRSPVRYGV